MLVLDVFNTSGSKFAVDVRSSRRRRIRVCPSCAEAVGNMKDDATKRVHYCEFCRVYTCETCTTEAYFALVSGRVYVCPSCRETD